MSDLHVKIIDSLQVKNCESIVYENNIRFSHSDSWDACTCKEHFCFRFAVHFGVNFSKYLNSEGILLFCARME